MAQASQSREIGKKYNGLNMHIGNLDRDKVRWAPGRAVTSPAQAGPRGRRRDSATAGPPSQSAMPGTEPASAATVAVWHPEGRRGKLSFGVAYLRECKLPIDF